MKLFVCLWALYAVADAGFLGLGGAVGRAIRPKYDQGHISNSHYGHDHGHGSSAQVFRVKVLNGGSGGNYGPGYAHNNGHDSGPKIIKVIHQESSGFSNGFDGHGHNGGNVDAVVKVIHQQYSQSAGHGGHGPAGDYSHSAAPEVIKLIHQQGESADGSSISASLGPVSAPAKVIKVIHEHSAGNAGSIQQQVSAPAKVIRVIHEHAAEQSGVQAASFPNAAVIAPDNNYLPPVQSPGQNFNSVVPQYSAPAQNIAAPNQYIPPLPQYNAPSSSFIAPEPVPVASHLPAQSYGPPNQ